MKVGSLFSGIGGLDLGLERVGMHIAWQSEIDPHASKVLAHHWPDVPNLGDVTVIDDPPPVDLICGGFPCQDVSVAGRREGLKGERSGLFFQFARIADAVRPRWLVVENVPGLLSSNAGRDFQTVIETLADIGYEDIAWRVVNSLGFGVPQRRRRLFIVGCLGTGARARQVLLEPEGREWHPPPRPEAGAEAARPSTNGARGDRPNVSHALCATRGQRNDPNEQTFVPVPASTVSTLQQSGGARGWRLDAEGAAGGQLVVYRKAQKAHHVEDCERWEEADYADTLAASGATSSATAVVACQDPISALERTGPLETNRYAQAIAVAARVRRLTPTECERLQGFPDGWTLSAKSDSARYRCLGNAVTVPVAQWLGQRILEEETCHPAIR